LPYLENVEFPVEPERIKEIFLHPKVTHSYRIEWLELDVQGVIDFICRQRDFSENRVLKALEKMQKGAERQKGKTTLERWFQ
jgi:flap endonuclease-1